MSSADDRVVLAVRRKQLELLLQKTGLVRLLSPIPFAAALAWIFHARWGEALPLVWLGLFVLVSVACFLRRRQWERRQPVADAQLQEALRDARRNILLLGILWGVAPWMLQPHGELAYLLLTSTFVVAAIALGSMLVASHQQTVAAGAGLIAAWAWFGGPMGWTLAACTTLFLLAALDYIRQQAAQTEHTLRTGVENEDLARRLAEQVRLVESANRDKTRFLAAASHDLRQPLHAVALFTSTLEQRPLAPQDAGTVARLAQSVRVLGDALDTLLDVSRLDAGAVQPRMQAVDLHGLFVRLQDTFGERAQEAGLQLRLRAPGDLVAWSDPQLLERLVANLVDNALKYTRHGGVLVAARRQGDDQVVLDVVDTGVGIAAQHQQQVFEEFYQVGNPQRDRGQGVGIGLAIVRRLSRLLAHPLELRSRPGRGTRVRLRLPRAQAPAREAAQAATVPPPARLPARVLVVDDEADNRIAMAGWLAAHGCMVCTAADAEAAEQVLLREPFDAVVADYRLAGARNGLDLLAGLRLRSPATATVLVTGDTTAGAAAAIAASGLRCLHKPVRAQQLLQALAAA